MPGKGNGGGGGGGGKGGGKGKPGGTTQIDGTENADTLVGTDGDDAIFGYGGNDSLSGGLGNDGIFGGEGDDVIDGGDGNDNLLGNEGNDSLTGGAGDDKLQGGLGLDTIDGGTEENYDTVFYWETPEQEIGGGVTITGITVNAVYDDPLWSPGDPEYEVIVPEGTESLTNIEVIEASNFDDVLNGGSQSDTFVGADGNDSLFGDDGADALYGGSGNDHIEGGDGADWISGGGDEDTLDGGAGDDTIYGDHGADLVIAHDGDGNDLIDGGFNDYLFGIEHDVVSYEAAGAGITLTTHLPDGSTYTYSVSAPGGTDTLINVEEVRGGAHDDHMTGGDQEDHFVGLGGNDSLSGGGENDILDGGAGDDDLDGGAGSDRFLFEDGWGNDTITGFEDGADLLDFSGSTLGFGDLTVAASGAADTLIDDGAGNSILLRDVAPASITADDFLFAPAP